ncbi:swr1 complex component [Podila humilis]|nr:swr1 complex component [Podila humilis]
MQTRDSESEATPATAASTTIDSNVIDSTNNAIPASSLVETNSLCSTDLARNQDSIILPAMKSIDHSGQGNSESTKGGTVPSSSVSPSTVSQVLPTDTTSSPVAIQSNLASSVGPSISLTTGVSSVDSNDATQKTDSPVVPVVPVKRGPGRPPRSLNTKPVEIKGSQESSTRPRRTVHSLSSDSPSAHNDASTNGRHTSSVSTSQARSPLHRTSTRHIRTPGKFLESVSVPPPLSTTTSANLKPLLNRRASSPGPVKKRGRPALHPQNQTPHSSKSTKHILPPPASVIPMKRGPGRPPRNPLTVKASPQLDTSPLLKKKSKSASPTMARSSNGYKASPKSAARSTASTPTESLHNSPPVKRGPGRPRRSDSSSTSSPTSPSSWRYPVDTQIVAPSSSSSLSPRSQKRYHRSDAEEEDGTFNYSHFDSGLTPRKKRVLSLSDRSSLQVFKGKAMEDLTPKILTPLDKARAIKALEWENKLQEVVEHHDGLARELFHLETKITMLTYDPVKIKTDYTEPMLRFLRKLDLWSQVPDLISTPHISDDRISTRRSANEKREQFVDLLQKNVKGALPKRTDLLSTQDSELIRRHSPYAMHAQYPSLGDYLDSFVYDDEEEVTAEQADRRAVEHADLLDRIAKMKAESGGRRSGPAIRAFVDPEVPKLHHNWLLEHVMTSSRLIKKEGEYQMARARKVSKMILRHFEQLHGKSERVQREEDKRIKKLAKLTANEVRKKWRYVEGIVVARHKALLKEEQEEAGKRHLNLILEHSTQILGVQQNTLSGGTPWTLGAPGTPGTPSQPASTASPSSMSDIVNVVPSAIDPGSRHTSATPTPIRTPTPMPTPISTSTPVPTPTLTATPTPTPSSTPTPTTRSSRQSSIASQAMPSVDSPPTDIEVGDDAEFAAVEMENDDETTMAQDESGSEDDEEEINGLAAEMDIPIEELLRQYGYQLSGDEESDESDIANSEPVIREVLSSVEIPVHIKSEPRSKPLTDWDMEADPSSEAETTQHGARKNNTRMRASPTQENTAEILDSIKIASSLPEGIRTANKTASRGRSTKRRRLSLTGLYRGPPLPYNPYDEEDDERTIEEEELEENCANDPIELSMLMREKDMPIEELLDHFEYQVSSSDYSDSYYDSDSDDDSSVMSSQQRIKKADPRFVVTLQDVVPNRKFPTRPSSQISDTDTEYDDNRTISIYGSDDELCLGDMLPLLDPIVQHDSEEEEDLEGEEMEQIDTSATGANVKTKVPFLLRHTLREYQHVGMDWLANLYSNGLNGILADEMGLGKTMQTIALLAHLACEHGIWGPHLIVVPTSVMLNWEMEFKKWCPGFKIVTYYGSPKERKEKRVGWSRENFFHVCITSYQLVVQDQSVFRRKAWQYLILDEAHNIKNFRSQRWQTLLNFNSARRLLLTGTPLQNNLMELWSLLYFLMPNGVSHNMPVGFANQKEFQEWFSHPVDRMIEGNEQQDDESKAAIARLHTVLRPYLLRRLKADVETQMPAKYEHIVYCRLSKRQRFLYDDFMSRAKTRETLATGNFMNIIGCLMQLRKVCNHPDLFEVRPIVTSFAMPSAVASFEINEFLVRRKMFSEVDLARESVNLKFLGLVFTGAEQSMSRYDVEALESLSTATCFSKKAAEFATPQAKTLQNSSQYQDARQYVAMRRHHLMQSNRQRWEQLEYVNSNRCNVQVMYGSSLIEMVRTPTRMRVGCFSIPDQVNDPRQFLLYSDALASAIVSTETRFKSNEETLKRFAFVTPAVTVKDPTWSPMHINASPSSTEIAIERAKELFHPVEACLQVQFPDKRLLQFDCGKLQKLDSLLRELKSGGHRALIFTQMTKVLDILEIFLNIHGHRYLRLDGATKVENRQHLTDRFNSDPKILAFILSTRSGGVGINLTGADTVIFYDSDWNPSMDRQCQDRCHRIGQTRDVHIYRFVSEFTIEENMLKKANQKRMLDNVVIQEGGFTTDFFQKMDWRDMLGEEDLAKIGDLGPVQPNGEPTDLSTIHGTDLEQALAAAEDENDVLAAQQAKDEMEGVDVNDFSEVDAAAAAATPNGQDGKSAQGTTDAQSRVHFEGEVGLEEGTVIEMGHVDEYMLRFAEREYGHYVGFGGLPVPPKKEYGPDGEILGEGSEGEDEVQDGEVQGEDEEDEEQEDAEAEAEAEEEEEEEKEEEEEEDEYDVEVSESEGDDAEEDGQKMDLD